MPEGEAHRHEPPIPHDGVVVDSRKNEAELKEEKKEPPAKSVDEEPNIVEKPKLALNMEDGKDDKVEKHAGAAGRNEQENPGGHAVSNEELKKVFAEEDQKEGAPPKEVEKLNPGKDAESAAAGAQMNEAGKSAEKVPEGEHHPAERAADGKDAADEKMEVIKKLVAEGQLDHAVLLQVIKEQQVQQKRLLDQQEKLLAVIEEQHKEIHQKQPAGAAEVEAEKSIQEGGAVQPKESDQAPELRAAGAPQAAGGEAPAGDTGAEVGGAKADAAAAYKEDDNAAPGGDSQKQSELGARGVPLGNKKPDDLQPVAPNDQVEQGKVEEKSIDKEKDTIENLKKEVDSRREKERPDVEVKENMAKEQQLEKEKLERELEKERELKLALRQQLEREEKERIEKEVLVRVEKERLEREKREEQEREKAKLVQELQKAEGEINERAKKVLQVEETQERLAVLQRAAEAKIIKEAEEGGEGEEGKALKNGGRDLKEQAAAQADPGEGLQDYRAIKAKPRPQSSNENAREQGDTDLKRRRRALGPREAAWPLKDSAESRGVPGLEPLLELGGSDLHAALEQQLLAGAVVHSRQMKQATGDDDGTK